MDQCMSLSSSFDPRYFRVCELDGMPHVSPLFAAPVSREGVHGGGGGKLRSRLGGWPLSRSSSTTTGGGIETNTRLNDYD